MKKVKDPSAEAADLRRRAKKRAQSDESGADKQRRVHELRAQQAAPGLQSEELRRSRAEVEAGLERYTELYDFAPVGYLTLGREGATRKVNLTGARLLGVDRDRLTGRRFGVLVDTPDRAAFGAFLEKAFASRAREVCEVKLLRQGEGRLDVRMTALVSQDGQECRIVMEDITEKKRLEDILAGQTRLLQAVRQAQNLFITQQDPREAFADLLKILVSATASQFGFLSEVNFDADGNPYRSSLAISDISWDEDSRRLYRQLVSKSLLFTDNRNLAGLPVLERRTVIANDVPQDPRAAGLPKGHPGLHAFMGIPVFFGDELIGLAGVANRESGYASEDAEFIEPLISACAGMIWAGRMRRREKEHLESLRRSEALLSTAQRLARVGGWEWDVVRRAATWTDGFYRIHELSPEEIDPGSAEHLSRSLECFDAKDRPRVLEAFRQCVEEGTPFDLELPFTTARSRRLWVRATAEAVTDGGRVVKIVGNLMDITERRQAQEALSRSEAELRSLYRALCDAREEERRSIAREVHDALGQSLTALRIDLAWLKRNNPPRPEQWRAKLDLMTQVVDTALETVQRVTAELRPGVLDALGLCAAAEWLVRDFEKRTEIQCMFRAEPEDIALDQHRSTAVFRMLQEALTNIARHSQANWVRVALRRRNGLLFLDVLDNGVGISEEQATSPMSLGLSGIRERVAELGGEMRIDSLPDSGTGVRISIPLEEQ